eukprot:scaffold49701_cov33-Tisochrysis_lutea.AAC.5
MLAPTTPRGITPRLHRRPLNAGGTRRAPLGPIPGWGVVRLVFPAVLSASIFSPEGVELAVGERYPAEVAIPRVQVTTPICAFVADGRRRVFRPELFILNAAAPTRACLEHESVSTCCTAGTTTVEALRVLADAMPASALVLRHMTARRADRRI